MDASRFDTFAKRLAAPTTRRATLGTAAAGGLLSVLGLSHASPAVGVANEDTCVFTFAANVRLGPSVEQVLTANGTRPGELRGELRFSLSETGKLENGVLRLPDGGGLPVVGQATGHSLQMRIELAPRAALIAVGVGEQEVAACQGAIDGVATGPEVGDLGDWHIAVPRRTGNTGRTNTDGSAASTGTRPIGAAIQTPNPGTTTSATTGSGSTGRTGATGSAAAAPTPTRRAGEMLDLTSPTGPGGSTAPSGPTAAASGATGPTGSSGSSGPIAEPGGCPPGHAYCSEGCVDIGSNDFNCGACDNQCADGQVCQGGVCTGAAQRCADGLTACHDVCVDLSNDDDNCGACGVDCGAADCISGVCAMAVERMDCAASGLTECAGICTNTMTDAANCGACGVNCGADPCISGVCTGVARQAPADIVLLSCEAMGLTNCGGVCVDLLTDDNNCGACGNACYPGLCSIGNGTCSVCDPNNEPVTFRSCA